jgi:hypothetical protein
VQPGVVAERSDRAGVANAVQRQVAILDSLGAFRPGSVSIEVQQAGVDLSPMENEVFLHTGDGCVAPDIHPGFGAVGGQQNLDNQHRVAQGFYCRTGGASRSLPDPGHGC